MTMNKCVVGLAIMILQIQQGQGQTTTITTTTTTVTTSTTTPLITLDYCNNVFYNSNIQTQSTCITKYSNEYFLNPDQLALACDKFGCSTGCLQVPSTIYTSPTSSPYNDIYNDFLTRVKANQFKVTCPKTGGTSCVADTSGQTSYMYCTDYGRPSNGAADGADESAAADTTFVSLGVFAVVYFCTA